jgi:hypothetical protein
VIAPALLPTNQHGGVGVVVSDPAFYYVALHLAENGVPEDQQHDSVVREADPAGIVEIVTWRTAPAEPAQLGAISVSHHMWGGQALRLLVDTPEPGPRLDRFRAWVERLRVRARADGGVVAGR